MKEIHHDGVIRRLCQIAARLNTLVLTVRDPQWTRKRLLGSCISVRRHLRVAKPEARALFAEHLATGGRVILLHVIAANRSDVLSHEIGHVVGEMSLLIDSRMGCKNRVSRVLNRAARRHGINRYCRSTRTELRAECIGRRLLGETLPPTLRRFTERAWTELCEKASIRP